MYFFWGLPFWDEVFLIPRSSAVPRQARQGKARGGVVLFFWGPLFGDEAFVDS